MDCVEDCVSYLDSDSEMNKMKLELRENDRWEGIFTKIKLEINVTAGKESLKIIMVAEEGPEKIAEKGSISF